MDDPVAEAELILQAENTRWRLRREQRRLMCSGTLLIVSGIATVLGGLLTLPTPRAVEYLAVGIVDGVFLRTVVATWWTNRQLLKRIERFRN